MIVTIVARQGVKRLKGIYQQLLCCVQKVPSTRAEQDVHWDLQRRPDCLDEACGQGQYIRSNGSSSGRTLLSTEDEFDPGIGHDIRDPATVTGAGSQSSL